MALAGRWPDRVAEVVAANVHRAWLLTADAGAALDDLGNPPEGWLELLPRYAELQRGETSAAPAHLAAGVPDLRLAGLPERFEGLVARPLPLEPEEIEAARRLGPEVERRVAELAGLAAGIEDTIEHADLHHRSVFARGGRLRILDWGDAAISHPFFSLAVTFHWLRRINGLAPDDPWFARLRDAYLEPWGPGLEAAFEAAQALGTLTRALGWLRHHDAMGARAFEPFDTELPSVLRAAFAALATTLRA